MSDENQNNFGQIRELFDRFRRQMGDDTGARRFSSFYWYTIPPFHEGENYTLMQPSSFATGFKRLFWSFLYLLHEFFSKWGSPAVGLLAGEWDPKAKVILQAWVRKEDLEKFCHSRETYSWGSLPSELEAKGIVSQFLIFPLFHPTEKEHKKLLETGSLVFCSSDKMNGSLVLGALLEAPSLFWRARSYLKKWDWAMAYLANQITVRSLKTRELTTLLRNKPFAPQTPTVLFSWEAQPEQRAFTAYFHRHGAKVMGVILTGVENHCGYLEKSDLSSTWDMYPERLIVPGLAIKNALSRIGWDPRTLQVYRSEKLLRNPAEYYQGVAFLPYSPERTRRYLIELKKLAAEKKLNCRRIQLHPNNRANPELAELVAAIPINPESKEVIVAGFSTILLEALELGLTVKHLTLDNDAKIDKALYPGIQFNPLTLELNELFLPQTSRGTLIATNKEKTLLDSLF